MKKRNLNLSLNQRFYGNLKHKKYYEKWLKAFVKKPSDDELNKMGKETFIKAFPNTDHIKYFISVNNPSYQSLQGA
jgi:hypothetical protein